MGFKILITAPYMQMVIDRFRSIFDEKGVELVIAPFQERFEQEQLLELVGDIDGVICGDDRFTEKVLKVAPKLKVLSKWGTGIDSIDQVACKKFGVEVRNTPNAFSIPVADTVLGYILNFARQLPWMDRAMRKGQWNKSLNVSLSESTIGVIGVGNVGKEVVKRAVAFGGRVLGNDTAEIPADFISKTGLEMVSKEELLKEADFISVNCDLNETSFHLISDDEFKLMKPTAVLVNAARGPIVDESALIKTLQAKEIGGAAMDVFEIEPLSGDSPLLKMDNVMVATHNSNGSVKAWEYVHQNTIDNLFEVLERS